jgi:hypothetical protein
MFPQVEVHGSIVHHFFGYDTGSTSRVLELALSFDMEF